MLPATMTAFPNLRSRPSLSESGEITTVGDVDFFVAVTTGTAAFVAALAEVVAGVALEPVGLFVAEVIAVAAVVVDAIGPTAAVGATDCGGVALAKSFMSLAEPFETGQKIAATAAKHTNSNTLQNIFITPPALNCQPLKFCKR
jgi:hypothetical protein